jgi:predicted phage baseplate assembly protein
MSQLAPDLFQRRYRDLVDLGRSRLPGLAPAWTDHNAHDPGITLIELLAWIGEAQLYSLSRMRRDERAAYAALMGIRPHGARPARGLIWPDHEDPAGPAATVSRGRVIDPASPIHLQRAEEPGFRAAHRQLWIPARIDSLASRLADGTIVRHDAANRGGPMFQPFGADDGRGAVLRMGLAAVGHAPLFEADRPADARLVIGVRADSPRGGAIGAEDGAPASPLKVSLLADGNRIPLPIVEDGSGGLLRTGALVLDIASVNTDASSATLEIEPADGFERAPRILRIEPNVLPIVQRFEVSGQALRSNGLPDQAFDLDLPGIAFEPGSDPVGVGVQLAEGLQRWAIAERLADCGPDDRCFMFDSARARIRFGNGVNGAVPPADAPILVRYTRCEGKAGNVAANRKWVVPGFEGLFGVNPDPTSGGQDPPDWLDQRREARRSLAQGHALVSAADFENAARDLSGLEVGRAWMMPPSVGDRASGTMRLVAMRARPSGEPAATPESARWLEAVRRRLAPRVPLGARLRVLAPVYADFSLRARVEAEPRRDPMEVRRAILDGLARRLTLVRVQPGDPQRPFGLPVTRRDLTAWIEALPGVQIVSALTIVLADGSVAEEVPVARNGLPRIDFEASEITVDRAGGGGAP